MAGSQFTEASIRSLIAQSELEHGRLDYKFRLPKRRDGEQPWELAKDVAAFANADGGLIIVGIAEEEGRPALAPMNAAEADSAQRTIIDVVKTNLDPQPTVNYHKVQLGSEKYVLVVEIAKHISSPYALVRNRLPQFWRRIGSANTEMTHEQIRQSFLSGATIGETVRLVLKERLARVAAGEWDVPLESAPSVLLLLYPHETYSRELSVDIGRALRLHHELIPGELAGWDARPDERGLIVHPRSNAYRDGYARVFRDGRIEIVDASVGRYDSRDNLWIHSPMTEYRFAELIQRSLGLLGTLGVTGPVSCSLSFLGWNQAGLIQHIGSQMRGFSGRIATAELHLLPVVLPSPQSDAGALMRPAFDVLWNAVGRVRAESYEEDGQPVWRSNKNQAGSL